MAIGCCQGACKRICFTITFLIEGFINEVLGVIFGFIGIFCAIAGRFCKFCYTIMKLEIIVDKMGCSEKIAKADDSLKEKYEKANNKAEKIKSPGLIVWIYLVVLKAVLNIFSIVCVIVGVFFCLTAIPACLARAENPFKLADEWYYYAILLRVVQDNKLNDVIEGYKNLSTVGST